jgi:hypothetical protein
VRGGEGGTASIADLHRCSVACDSNELYFMSANESMAPSMRSSTKLSGDGGHMGSQGSQASGSEG